MPALIPIFLTFVAGIIQFIIRHPFISKMMIFTLFTGLIVTATQYLLSLAQPYVFQNEYLALAAYFGVLQALSLFLSILMAGFAVKQILAFIRST